MDEDLSAPLLARGTDLLSRLGTGTPAQRDELVHSLVAAYGDKRRGYHDLRHLTEVLDHVDVLAPAADNPDLVRLAAWFHDAVYASSGRTGADEEASAALAGGELSRLGLDADDVGTVVRLVRLTATHDPAEGDHDGAVLSDADLAVLARDDAGYARYVAGVRREYAHVGEADFRHGRAAVLHAIADRPRLFRTDAGHAWWESAARRNLAAELALLRDDAPA